MLANLFLGSALVAPVKCEAVKTVENFARHQCLIFGIAHVGSDRDIAGLTPLFFWGLWHRITRPFFDSPRELKAELKVVEPKICLISNIR